MRLAVLIKYFCLLTPKLFLSLFINHRWRQSVAISHRQKQQQQHLGRVWVPSTWLL